MTDPSPTADEIARWAAAHHGWTPEDYPDSGEFCVECGEHMPCPLTRLLALVAAQAEEIAGLRGEVAILTGMHDVCHRQRDEAQAELHAIHATDDYQRWARAVAERDAAREQVARVRELCDEYRANCDPTSRQAEVAELFRAALDPQPPAREETTE